MKKDELKPQVRDFGETLSAFTVMKEEFFPTPPLNAAVARLPTIRARLDFAYAAAETLARARWVKVAQDAFAIIEGEIERMKNALEVIAWECDPNDPEWHDAAGGRAFIFGLAQGALAQPGEIA